MHKSKRQSKRHDRKSTKEKKEKYPPDSHYKLELKYFTLDQVTEALGIKFPDDNNYVAQFRQLRDGDTHRICIEIWDESSEHVDGEGEY